MRWCTPCPQSIAKSRTMVPAVPLVLLLCRSSTLHGRCCHTSLQPAAPSSPKPLGHYQIQPEQPQAAPSRLPTSQIVQIPTQHPESREQDPTVSQENKSCHRTATMCLLQPLQQSPDKSCWRSRFDHRCKFVWPQTAPLLQRGATAPLIHETRET